MMAKVEYVANLSAPKHIEQVECIDRRTPGLYADERICVLKRSGQRITAFVASEGQRKKIAGRKGKLQITDRMIQRTR
jgi:hypothetical protein